MDWSIIYHTDSHFEPLLDELKHHGYTPEVFCDPDCRQLYMPGIPTAYKCRIHFYVAVPHDQRLNAESIVHQWMQLHQETEHHQHLKTFQKALAASVVTAAVLTIYYIIRFRYLTPPENADPVTEMIIGFVLCWTGCFVFLISRKSPSSDDYRDFT